MAGKLKLLSCAWCVLSSRCPMRGKVCPNYVFDQKRFFTKDYAFYQTKFGHKGFSPQFYLEATRYILNVMSPFYLTVSEMEVWMDISKFTFDCYCQLIMAGLYPKRNKEIYKRRHLKAFWERFYDKLNEEINNVKNS